MKRSLALLPLFLFACGEAARTGDAAESSANATAAWTPFPTEVRPGMRRLEPLDPLGASVGDFGTAARDQGTIASCASFSFLGLIENQMYNERGITPDLSERFMIYSNYLQTGSLGGEVPVIRRFPQLTASIGLLPEDVYPYEAVAANSTRFMADAAQGLKTATNEVLLSDAITGTADDTLERSAIITRADYVGALPAGARPVLLPLKATLQPNARVPQVEYDGAIVSCFAKDPSTQRRLAVSPRELLAMCFDLEPADYFTCDFSFDDQVAHSAPHATGDNECARTESLAEHIAKAQYAANSKALRLVLGLLDHGNAALLGVIAGPAETPIWDTTRNLPLSGGHAVVGVGYVAADELGRLEEQSRGILANGMFDRFAALAEPDYAAKLGAIAPTDAGALRDLRLGSKLGQRTVEEGGLILFRNSWGSTQVVGVDGYQSMTFDFFLKAKLNLVQGRKAMRMPGVDWASATGGACPASVNAAYGGRWLSESGPERVRARVISEALAGTGCTPSR